QLLRCRQSCGTGAYNCDFLAGAQLRGLRTNQSFLPATLDNAFFNLLDRDRRLVNAEHACRLTRRGTDAAGELWEVVGRVKLPQSLFPASVVNQIIPVGNEVIDRASGVAEGYAAIHAARALGAKLLFGEVLIDLEPIVHALRHRTTSRAFAGVVHE